VTEEEAKTKRCHLVQRDPRDRPLPAHPNELCIGSACSAWRWLTAKETEAFLAIVRRRMKETGENFAKATQAALIENQETFVNTEGFCGLAGAPK
jgi:hypothetical protein